MNKGERDIRALAKRYGYDNGVITRGTSRLKFVHLETGNVVFASPGSCEPRALRNIESAFARGSHPTPDVTEEDTEE